jgi:hypothetical protein
MGRIGFGRTLFRDTNLSTKWFEDDFVDILWGTGFVIERRRGHGGAFGFDRATCEMIFSNPIV